MQRQDEVLDRLIPGRTVGVLGVQSGKRQVSERIEPIIDGDEHDAGLLDGFNPLIGIGIAAGTATAVNPYHYRTPSRLRLARRPYIEDEAIFGQHRSRGVGDRRCRLLAGNAVVGGEKRLSREGDQRLWRREAEVAERWLRIGHTEENRDIVVVTEILTDALARTNRHLRP